MRYNWRESVRCPWLSVAVVCGAFSIAGCGGEWTLKNFFAGNWSLLTHPETPENPPTVYVLSGGDEKPGAQTVAQEVNPEDLIEPSDILEVVVRVGAREERNMVPVRANGNVTISFVDIQVKGLSEGQAEDRINKELARVIRFPNAQVRIQQKGGAGRERWVFVTGEVKFGGRFKYFRGLSVLQAIASAQGVTDQAYLDKIVLISKGTSGRPMVRVVNIQAVIRYGDQSGDLPLQENDVVFVPRTEAGDFFNYYNKVASPVINTIFGTLNAVFIGKTLDQAFRTPVDQGVQPAIPVCWVAGVLYGDHAWQTRVLRWYIIGPLSDHWAGQQFAMVYRAYGRQVAAVLREYPALQAVVRPLFDRLLADAVEHYRAGQALAPGYRGARLMSVGQAEQAVVGNQSSS